MKKGELSGSRIITKQAGRNILILLVIIGLIMFVQSVLDGQPERKEVVKFYPFETLPPAEYLGVYLASVILGGFKPLLVDFLWIKADKLQRDLLYEEVLVIMKLIARFHPHFVEVWDFNSYLMAYNLSRGHSKEKEWLWIKSAINYALEGLSWNPHSPQRHKLFLRLGFIFSHRIPQADYLVEEVEKEYQRSTYKIAAEWYQKVLMEYRRIGKSEYGWESMIIACLLCESFDLVRKEKFDEARDTLIKLADKCQEIKKKYKLETTRWEKEREQFLALADVFEVEKKLSSLKKAAPMEYLRSLPDLLSHYKNFLEKYPGLYIEPVTKHLDRLFLTYVKVVFELMKEHKFDLCKAIVNQAIENVAKMIPQDSYHPITYFTALQHQRFIKFANLLQSEEILAQAIASNNLEKILSELEKILNEYRSYFSTFGEEFNLDYEYERYQKLKDWRKKLR